MLFFDCSFKAVNLTCVKLDSKSSSASYLRFIFYQKKTILDCLHNVFTGFLSWSKVDVVLITNDVSIITICYFLYKFPHIVVHIRTIDCKKLIIRWEHSCLINRQGKGHFKIFVIYSTFVSNGYNFVHSCEFFVRSSVILYELLHTTCNAVSKMTRLKCVWFRNADISKLSAFHFIWFLLFQQLTFHWKFNMWFCERDAEC